MSRPKTLFEKIWDRHVVHHEKGHPALLYIDRHLVHEVTSPQAFEGLRLTQRPVRRPDLTFATMDHNVPTFNRMQIDDPISKKQIDVLKENCKEFGVTLFGLDSPDQGIVHVIGPELGITLPGLTIVCGDSHTSTHGAFGSLAFGIGTSEVEHVLATQCLPQRRPRTMEIRVDGELSPGVTAKDVILAIIGKIGTSGGTGCVVEYTGSVIRNLTIEQRMTVCNMSIEGGARAGMIAPDEKTFEYCKGRRYAPKGDDWDRAVEEWKSLPTDEGAEYDETVILKAEEIEPQVTWGTTPGMVTNIRGHVPRLDEISDEQERQSIGLALEYMGLEPGTPIEQIAIDRVFIGSCTNARISDLREAAKFAKGKKVNSKVSAMVVPGSMSVKRQAEEEGLDVVFREAGFDWREAGCSMCLGMNPDTLDPQERCASTSNRNFEGRQGKGGRTHLVSPVMAVAAAVEGHFVDIRNWPGAAS